VLGQAHTTRASPMLRHAAGRAMVAAAANSRGGVATNLPAVQPALTRGLRSPTPSCSQSGARHSQCPAGTPMLRASRAIQRETPLCGASPWVGSRLCARTHPRPHQTTRRHTQEPLEGTPRGHSKAHPGATREHTQEPLDTSNTTGATRDRTLHPPTLTHSSEHSDHRPASFRGVRGGAKWVADLRTPPGGGGSSGSTR